MTDDQTQLIEEMFVQLPRSVTTTEGSMTLLGASPSTLYFSDRPERVVGTHDGAAVRGPLERGAGQLRLRSTQCGCAPSPTRAPTHWATSWWPRPGSQPRATINRDRCRPGGSSRVDDRRRH
jgi:hypothetical protein